MCSVPGGLGYPQLLVDLITAPWRWNGWETGGAVPRPIVTVKVRPVKLVAVRVGW